jgi:hypothetical protein
VVVDAGASSGGARLILRCEVNFHLSHKLSTCDSTPRTVWFDDAKELSDRYRYTIFKTYFQLAIVPTS